MTEVLPAVSAELRRRLENRTARIGVLGLGYVGLPLATEYAVRGFATVGIDLDNSRVEAINSGRNYIQDVDAGTLADVVGSRRLTATASVEEADSLDVVFICVPTPVTDNKDPDTSFITSAARDVAAHLRAGQLIILKSTTYPNTTEGLVQPILEDAAKAQGLTLGEDYFLAFSPERMDPGNKRFHTGNTPLVVGGVTPNCTRLAALAMRQIVDEIHEVSSPRVAEMEKLLENIFRSVNIALVNELARLCDRMGGISIWEVIEAASTKPFGFMPFYPGPGLGGHCIPIDPYYLSWLARQYDFETSFITLSAKTNDEMPYYVVTAAIRALAEQPVSTRDARVLVVGAAFKKNIDDTRHSPSLRVIDLLKRAGIGTVDYADPHVSSLQVDIAGKRVRLESVELTKDTLSTYNVAILITDHDDLDFDMIAASSACIIDTRNAFAGVSGPKDHIRVLGTGAF